jgi:hypothetical protein
MITPDREASPHVNGPAAFVRGTVGPTTGLCLLFFHERFFFHILILLHENAFYATIACFIQ